MASRMYDGLKIKYENSFITKDTLKGWVELNKKKSYIGITATEFEEITGESYADGSQ